MDVYGLPHFRDTTHATRLSVWWRKGTDNAYLSRQKSLSLRNENGAIACPAANKNSQSIDSSGTNDIDGKSLDVTRAHRSMLPDE